MNKEEKQKYDKIYRSTKEYKEKEKLRNQDKKRKEWRKKYAKLPYVIEQNKKYHNELDVKKKYKNLRLLRQYNISLEEYEFALQQQNFSCLACKTHQSNCKRKTLMIDHCHTTGKFRGLLCHNCNVALGMVKENVDILLNLIKYLKGEEE